MYLMFSVGSGCIIKLLEMTLSVALGLVVFWGYFNYMERTYTAAILAGVIAFEAFCHRASEPVFKHEPMRGHAAAIAAT